jgi:hypothetical protein
MPIEDYKYYRRENRSRFGIVRGGFSPVPKGEYAQSLETLILIKRQLA